MKCKDISCRQEATSYCADEACKISLCPSHFLEHNIQYHESNYSDYDEQVSKTLDTSPPRSEIAIDKAWEDNNDRYKK